MHKIFKPIEYSEAIDFLLPRHYSGRKPSVSYAFGYYEGKVLKAVCTIGKPANKNLCTGSFGECMSSRVYELNRLCVDGDIKIQLSEFVAYCFNYLKPENLIIFSYVDTQMNHFGIIYQATNFIYTGATARRTDPYLSDSKHQRHTKCEFTGLRTVRSSKHRYLYIAGGKKFKKRILKDLNYKILPYPKGVSQRYKLGDFIKPEIVKDKRSK